MTDKTLVERLRVTQEALAITRSALIHRAYCASLQGDFACNCGKAGALRKVDAMLAQFEKENSDACTHPIF